MEYVDYISALRSASTALARYSKLCYNSGATEEGTFLVSRRRFCNWNVRKAGSSWSAFFI